MPRNVGRATLDRVTESATHHQPPRSTRLLRRPLWVARIAERKFLRVWSYGLREVEQAMEPR